MDEEWLEAVLTEIDGCQYSVFDVKQLVAVVGIKFPSEKYPAYYITDVAVHPQLRGEGIGKAVLRQLERLHPLVKDQTWRAWVATDNPKAKHFFEKNGWQQKGRPDEHGMYLMELTNHHLPLTVS